MATEEASALARALRLAEELARQLGVRYGSIEFPVVAGRVPNLHERRTRSVHDLEGEEEAIAAAARGLIPGIDEVGGLDDGEGLDGGDDEA
jgi:hypothetical protein